MFPLLGLLLSGATLSACSGGSHPAATAPLPTAPRASSATRPSAATTTAASRPAPPTTVRAGPGAADTTPPPPLLATGHDYAAIAHSLMVYSDWIFAHRPDPDLADTVFNRGTTPYVNAQRLLATLKSKQQTLVSVDHVLTFTGTTMTGPYVTLRMRETLVEDQTFDRNHHVVDTHPYPGVQHFDLLLLSDAGGRWRIGGLTPVATDPVIVLPR